MRRAIIVVFFAAVFVLAGNVCAFKTPNYKRNWYSSLHLGGQSHIQSGLRKTASSPAVVSRIIQDSNTTYTFSTGLYAPSSVTRYQYTDNGQIRSVNFQGLDALPNTFYNNYSISFTDDGNGNLTTDTLRYGRDISSSFGYAYQFNPPLSDSLAPYNDAGGTGYILNCQSIRVFLYLSILNVQVKDSGKTNWRIAGRDTVLSRKSDLIVFVDQDWDTVSRSFATVTLDSLFLSSARVVKVVEYSYSYDTMKTVYSGVYDSTGKEIEETVLSFSWDNSAMAWLPSITWKYVQTFNDHGDLVLSVQQDSTDHWVPIDSCDKYLYTYSYDSTGLIQSRVDSTWLAYGAPTKGIHYFTYQTFLSAIFPRQFRDNPGSNGAKLYSNGMIKTKTPVSVSLYTISGRRIATLPVTASISLWECCKNNGIRVGKGVYLAKVRGVNATFAVWRE
jgi:hypothetical protein